MQGARQATTPVQFNRMQRVDEGALMSSGDPGVVTPVSMIPVLRGDSCSGNFAIDVRMAEMPRPLLNGVMCNVQAWFVPKLAHAQFAGYDEFQASYTGEPIETLGETSAADPKDFFRILSELGTNDLASDEVLHTLGIHNPEESDGRRYFHDDLHDAFSLIYNFRLAAHSNKLARRLYCREAGGFDAAKKLPKAFWPSGNRSGIVADYERALVVGALDLDVSAGQVPISSANLGHANVPSTGTQFRSAPTASNTTTPPLDANGNRDWTGIIQAEMADQQITTSLANIDKARELQSFANLRAAMQGNDTTGFNNDDAIMAELMRGFRVPETEFNRPWLLDSARVPFGMTERPATDGASLDQSVTTGQASASVRLNLPEQDVGGVIIITIEVMPERIDERMSDEWLKVGSVNELPDALRDVLRTEPVDAVTNRRIDALHTDPNALYGFEPMNNKWNRRYTRLGGAFYQDDPANPWTEQRSAIWQANVVDPEYTADHFLCPSPFPKYVFSDTTAPAFEFVARHNVAISGLTQIGDVLHENNDDYAAISGEQEATE